MRGLTFLITEYYYHLGRQIVAIRTSTYMVMFCLMLATGRLKEVQLAMNGLNGGEAGRRQELEDKGLLAFSACLPLKTLAQYVLLLFKMSSRCNFFFFLPSSSFSAINPPASLPSPQGLISRLGTSRRVVPIWETVQRVYVLRYLAPRLSYHRSQPP